MLDGVDITHSWYGYVAMNRDMIPRVFSRHGMRYAAGYCGSGVVWARWAGQKAAWQVLGDERGLSALDFRPPPTDPALQRQALVPAGRLRLDDPARPPDRRRHAYRA